MGTFPLHYDRVAIIASERLWLEDSAVQQLNTTAQLAGMVRVVGLPDLHPGRGYPVGAAFFSVGRFYPALVGNDIGCGMALWQTDILAGKAKLSQNRSAADVAGVVAGLRADGHHALAEAVHAAAEAPT